MLVGPRLLRTQQVRARPARRTAPACTRLRQTASERPTSVAACRGSTCWLGCRAGVQEVVRCRGVEGGSAYPPASRSSAGTSGRRHRLCRALCWPPTGKAARQLRAEAARPARQPATPAGGAASPRRATAPSPPNTHTHTHTSGHSNAVSPGVRSCVHAPAVSELSARSPARDAGTQQHLARCSARRRVMCGCNAVSSRRRARFTKPAAGANLPRRLGRHPQGRAGL